MLGEVIARVSDPQHLSFADLWGHMDLRLRQMRYLMFLSVLISLVGKDSIKHRPRSLREQHGKI